MKTLYLFEGSGRACIAWGTKPEGKEHKSFMVRHLGLFGKKGEIENLPIYLFGQEKPLFIDGKKDARYTYQRIYRDFNRQNDHYTPDMNPELLAQVKNYQNENEVLRNRLNELETFIKVIFNDDLLGDVMKKKFAAVGDAKAKLNQFDPFFGMGGYPFGGARPMSPGGEPTQ